ncbi:CD47-like protein [Brazilian porcupinepox virus 1]|nr:CD47-like protein [Brazilian porcupinepox virus 1]
MIIVLYYFFITEFFFLIIAKDNTNTISYNLCNKTVNIPCNYGKFDNNNSFFIKWIYNDIIKLNNENNSLLSLNFSYNLSGNYKCIIIKKNNIEIKNINLKFVNYSFKKSDIYFIITSVSLFLLILWLDIFVITFRVKNISYIFYYYMLMTITSFISLYGQYVIFTDNNFNLDGIIMIQLSILIMLILEIKLYYFIERYNLFSLFIYLQIVCYIFSSFILFLSYIQCYSYGYIYTYLYYYKLIFIDIFALLCLILLSITPINDKIYYKKLYHVHEMLLSDDIVEYDKFL